MKIGIVGATGMVGQNIIQILQEENLPVKEWVLMASEKSVGDTISIANKEERIISIKEGLNKAIDIVFFAAGGTISKQYAPEFAKKKCYVIDNSSAFRMTKDIPLVVPEINGNKLKKENYLISNPNCSTSQLVLGLHPIAEKYGIEQVIVSTYQSVSGSGIAGIEQLKKEEKGAIFNTENSCYSAPIHRNIIPHIDVFLENGYTKEEMKVMEESKKILNLPQLKIAATAVRVPVMIGHAESVSVKLKKAFKDVQELKEIFANQEGLIIEDNTKELLYPTPIKAANKNEVFVGRIRADLDDPNSFHCWVVSDNLRKGAAYNAVQIAQYIQRKFL